jgi:hypothetical protein
VSNKNGCDCNTVANYLSERAGTANYGKMLRSALRVGFLSGSDCGGNTLEEMNEEYLFE